ncbi:hypothetical protein AAC387_Pa03g1420 [Persea americana]
MEDDGSQEMGSVRWVLKGRDGAWRRWVVRDEEEMMMGCCVREMEMGSLGSASDGDEGSGMRGMMRWVAGKTVERGEMEERVRTESLKRRGGGRWRWAQKKREDRGRGRPEREMDVREMGSVMIKGRDDGMESKMGCGVREMEMVGGFCVSRRR